jgi:hypothetical protein
VTKCIENRPPQPVEREKTTEFNPCLTRSAQFPLHKSGSSSYPYVNYDQSAIDEYAAYLSKLSSALAGHPALFAYDLYNEPHYSHLAFKESTGLVGDNPEEYSKAEICEITHTWYNAIKTNAPDQMVTLGGAGINDISAWDPAVVHLDFYSLHIYPPWDILQPYDFAARMRNYQRELDWFGKICPIPWIIGETGFSANDDPHQINVGPNSIYNPIYHQHPYMYGSEQEQADFAESSFHISRQCGASGWSWWNFQDYTYYGYANEHAHQNYFGLLRLAKPHQTWPEKLIVDRTRNFLQDLQPRPASPGAPLPQNEHENPWGWTTDIWITGSIVNEANNEPLTTGTAWMWASSAWDFELMQTDPPYAKEELLPSFVHYTDANGEFTFREPPTIDGYFAYTMEQVGATGAAAQGIIYGNWPGTAFPPNGSTYPIKLHSIYDQLELKDVTIPSSELLPQFTHHGWSTLLVENVVFEGGPEPGMTNSELTASHEINVKVEFHAQVGSNVHIYTQEVFPECNDQAMEAKSMAYGQSEDPGVMRQEHASSSSKTIHLDFEKPTDLIQVHPNPFQDMLIITNDGDVPLHYTLTDQLGRIIAQGFVQSDNAQLDLPRIAPGAYRLHVKKGDKPSTFNLICQP